jgi:hypothetical protein
MRYPFQEGEEDEGMVDLRCDVAVIGAGTVAGMNAHYERVRGK